MGLFVWSICSSMKTFSLSLIGVWYNCKHRSGVGGIGVMKCKCGVNCNDSIYEQEQVWNFEFSCWPCKHHEPSPEISQWNDSDQKR